MKVEYYPDEALTVAQGDHAQSTSEHSDSEGSQWLAALRQRRAQEGKSKTKVKIGPELAALGFYMRSMKPVGDDFLVKRTSFLVVKSTTTVLPDAQQSRTPNSIY